MNTIWSENVQGVQTLFLSRRLRFDDVFAQQYRRAFGLDEGKALRLLEIGCGPGALAEALHRWYPRAKIWGVDRDSRFITHARQAVPGVEFVEGDIQQLPFPDNSFDAVISYTVQEHIEPTAFWGEQRRVLKPGGVCLCLSVRRSLTSTAPCLEPTEAEKTFWAQCQEELSAYGVGKYAVSEAELPAAMERHGFGEVTVSYAAIDLTPDDPKYPPQLAEAMIEAQRQGDLEAIASAHSGGEAAAAEAVNRKYDQRLQLYRRGEKQWDTAVTLTLIARGRKC